MTFTCVTRGASIIAWTSDDYIGMSQLEFGTFDTTGAVDRNEYNTANATLTGNELVDEVRVLTSVLEIRTSLKFPTSSVTCVHTDGHSGAKNSTSLNFEVLGMSNKVYLHWYHILYKCRTMNNYNSARTFLS